MTIQPFIPPQLADFEPWLRCACNELSVPYILPQSEAFWLVFDLFVIDTMSDTFNIGVDTAIHILTEGGMDRRHALVYLAQEYGADPCLCALGNLAQIRLDKS